MTNILVPKLFGFAKKNLFFAFSAPPFSMGETLYVALLKLKSLQKAQQNLSFSQLFYVGILFCHGALCYFILSHEEEREREVVALHFISLNPPVCACASLH